MFLIFFHIAVYTVKVLFVSTKPDVTWLISLFLIRRLNSLSLSVFLDDPSFVYEEDMRVCCQTTAAWGERVACLHRCSVAVTESRCSLWLLSGVFISTLFLISLELKHNCHPQHSSRMKIHIPLLQNHSTPKSSTCIYLTYFTFCCDVVITPAK